MKLICSNYFIPKRYWIIFLAFLGEALMYILRTNLSIAIVDMTTDRNITIGNRTYIEKSEFNWSSVEKGILLSLFSYGFLLTPAGSLLSIKYGGATICGLGIGLTGLLTIVTPFLLRFNFVVYSIARVMEGVFEGFITSGCVQLFIHWIPPEERSRSMVFVQVGGFFGAIVNYPLCGYIANSFGWPGIFYVSAKNVNFVLGKIHSFRQVLNVLRMGWIRMAVRTPPCITTTLGVTTPIAAPPLLKVFQQSGKGMRKLCLTAEWLIFCCNTTGILQSPGNSLLRLLATSSQCWSYKRFSVHNVLMSQKLAFVRLWGDCWLREIIGSADTLLSTNGGECLLETPPLRPHGSLHTSDPFFLQCSTWFYVSQTAEYTEAKARVYHV
ncbi:hypothetical protein PGB90_002322 [Kerria lacca]